MSEFDRSSAPADVQRSVIDRAETDPVFHAHLLQDPKAAIEEQFGIPLPADIRIRVVEEQPGEVVLVLPAQSTGSGEQLSEADLEQVAGGLETFMCSWIPGDHGC
jgi:hypothetical protein